MVGQAQKAGVKMNATNIVVPANPIIHDKSDNIQRGEPLLEPGFFEKSEDRVVRYMDGKKTTQRRMADKTTAGQKPGLAYQNIPIEGVINYTDRAKLDRDTNGTVDAQGMPTGYGGDIITTKTGTVDMKKYRDWLLKNGYDLPGLTIQ